MDPGTQRLQILFFLIIFLVLLDFLVVAAWFTDNLGRISRARVRIAWSLLGVTFLGFGCFLYALVIEAGWVEVTRQTVQTAKLPRGTSLRIVHLSDLHADTRTSVMEELTDRVNALQPDLIVFTGDTVNARAGLELARETLSGMNAPLGRYAVKGNHDVWYWSALDLFGGGVATELTGAPLQAGPLLLCGAAYGVTGHAASCLESAPERFRIFAYHTPDLVEDLAPTGVDLYLAGHTHGGQVRLPFYGAVITYSKFDKKFEMGRYQVRDTTLYVNRGLGFEPGAPKIRFLCRPEITVITLEGTGTR